MPFYQFNVLIDLTEEERRALVDRVIRIHTSKFQTPTLFVNVGFQDARKTNNTVYHGGLPGMLNSIQCFIRPGGRSQEQFQEVVTEVSDAWNEVINGSREKVRGNGMRTLQGVFVYPVIAAAGEWGFVLPEGGQDGGWLLEHRKEFEQLAAEGNKEFQLVLDEMDSRQDLQSN